MRKGDTLGETNPSPTKANARSRSEATENIYYLQSAERLLDVLECFTPENTELSLAELHKKTSINKTTLIRILNSLANRQMIAVKPSLKTYSLGVGILKLYRAVSWAYRMEEVCTHHMRLLRDRIGETVALYRMEGYRKVCVICLDSLYALRNVIKAGESYPLYVNAPGRALMAQMSDEELSLYMKNEQFVKLTSRTETNKARLVQIVEEAKERGYCISREESYDGVCAIAAPLRLPAVYGRHSLALVVPTIRFKDSEVNGWAGQLLNCCESIEKALNSEQGVP